MRFGGFGPWRPEWSLMRLPGLAMPFLGVLGLEYEEMGWGTKPEDVAGYLPLGARFVPLAEHRPLRAHRAARGRAPTSSSSLLARHERPAGCATSASTSRCTSCDAGGDRPLLLLHGLGERTPRQAARLRERLARRGVGPRLHRVTATVDVPSGGGYTCEVLMGDADAALAELGPATCSVGGSARTSALLIAGARPSMVRGAVLSDGPGLAGGGTGPVVHDVDRCRRRCGACRPTRSRSPSSRATCGRPTTRPRSPARP